MKSLAGWDGPKCLAEGIYRYSKYVSWTRLYIDVEVDGGSSEFYGGISGACTSFEVELENGQWKRFETDPAWTPEGEPVLRLREYTTWDVVYDRISEGLPLEEEIETIEDLAEYLEKCFL